MKRGELYLVRKKSKVDTKRQRVFVVVSRQVVIDSRFSTIICAPVYTTCGGLSTQLEIGPEHGLKHHCCIHCDELVSLPKNVLKDYIGTLQSQDIDKLNQAIAIAVGIA